MREPERRLTGEILGETIATGILEPNDDGTVTFCQTYDGVAFYIIAAYHIDDYPVIVTGWPYLYDEEMALGSDRWDIHDVNTIREFNAGNKKNRASDWQTYMEWNRTPETS